MVLNNNDSLIQYQDTCSPAHSLVKCEVAMDVAKQF